MRGPGREMGKETLSLFAGLLPAASEVVEILHIVPILVRRKVAETLGVEAVGRLMHQAKPNIRVVAENSTQRSKSITWSIIRNA